MSPQRGRGRRVAVAVGSIGALAVLGGIGWLLIDSAERDEERVAAGLAAGLRGATSAALAIAEPHRCARLMPEVAGAGAQPRHRLELAGQTWEISGRWLRRTSSPAGAEAAGRLIIGAVADARGVADHLPAIRRAFAAAGVELVLSLGGMAASESQLRELLGALAAPKSWPLLAIPGDREPVQAHRAAVAALSEQAVVDGSRIRLVAAGEVTVATLPGAPYTERLLAGHDGCLCSERDARDIAAELARAALDKGVRIVASHTPPRQEGPGAGDRANEGIHIGEPWLADALAEAGAHIAVHGLLAPPAHRGNESAGSKRSLGQTPVILAAGSADGIPPVASATAGHRLVPGTPALPAPSLALVLIVEPDSITWQRVAVEKTTP